MQIPRSYLENYSRMLNVVSERARKALAQALPRIDYTQDVADIRNQVIEVMQKATGASTIVSARIASEFYDGLRARFGIDDGFEAHVEPGWEPAATEENVRAFVHDLEGKKPLEGFFNKCIQSIDAETRRAANRCMVSNAKRDPKRPRWARVPVGAETCEWCIMLAGRGFVYHTEDLASHAHAHCNCRIVPSWDKSGASAEGYDPDYYYDCYKHPEDHPEIKEARNARRRELRAQRRAEKEKKDDLIAASYNFMSKGDELYERMQKIEPEEGFSDYAIHSDGRSFDRINDPKSTLPLSPVDIVNWIKSDPSYEGGAVRLLACSAGRYPDGVAKQVADLLGATVRAPTKDLFVSFDGKYAIAESKDEALLIMKGIVEQEEGWVDFEPEGSGS